MSAHARFSLVACLVVAMTAGVGAQTQPAKQKQPAATPKQPAAAQKQPAAPAQPSAQTTPVAGTPALASQYGDWGVYVSQGGRTKVCYALAQPKDRQPGNLKRDAAYVFVSTRPGENVRNEVAVIVGFSIKEGSEATAEVGGANFALYTKGDSAWVRNVAEEAKLVDALRKGRDLTVKSTSTRGNVTTDRYALTGLAQALDRVAQECR